MDFSSSKKYEVQETSKVLEDLDDFVYYLLVEKMNVQAADAVLSDYDETINELTLVAGSLKRIDNTRIPDIDLRKIRFRRHNYCLVYELDNTKAIVHRMFHDLQDLDGALKEI